MPENENIHKKSTEKIPKTGFEFDTGEFIRKGRQSKKLTQAALAAMIDVHPITVNAWESNRRQIDAVTFLRIVKTLQLEEVLMQNLECSRSRLTQPEMEEAVYIYKGLKEKRMMEDIKAIVLEYHDALERMIVEILDVIVSFLKKPRNKEVLTQIKVFGKISSTYTFIFNALSLYLRLYRQEQGETKAGELMEQTEEMADQTGRTSQGFIRDVLKAYLGKPDLEKQQGKTEEARETEEV